MEVYLQADVFVLVCADVLAAMNQGVALGATPAHGYHHDINMLLGQVLVSVPVGLVS